MDDVDGEARANHTIPPISDRYPSMQRSAHEWRSRKANGVAALMLLGAIVLVVLLLAIFA